MVKIRKKKNITLDDLALMVGEGFNEISEKMATKTDIAGLSGRMDRLEGRMGKLEHKMEALDSSVKNYLELSDKRYLELRQTNRVIFKYLKLIAHKAKIPVDLAELESLVK